MNLNREDYRRRVNGCWMGKNIGGTLGAPFEFWRQVNDVSFYTQELGGEPLPNDDLDLQLLWLIALEEQGIDIDAHVLGEYWCLYITPHWSEYGISKTNLRSGLAAPVSGMYCNEWKDSCGAFIRSEIWACVAPGRPDVAVGYAVEDGIVDHGDGEGTWGEVFFAAMESAAFVCGDLDELIRIGLSYLPGDSGVARAILCAVDAHKSGVGWREARDLILEHHRGATLFGLMDRTSEEDRKKGFAEGKMGYDAPSNVALTVLALLVGGDDFGKVVCTAVNCGEDTDCTAATAGAVFGLMHGIEAVPQKWIEPIGQKIKTMCLNLGELGSFGGQVPGTIGDLCERTELMAERVMAGNVKVGRRKAGVLEATEVGGEVVIEDLYASQELAADLAKRVGVVRYRFEFFVVDVEMVDGPGVGDGQAKVVRLTIHNIGKIQAKLDLKWHTPEGWFVEPSGGGTVFSMPKLLGKAAELEFTVNAGQVGRGGERCVVSMGIEARPGVMVVPVVFVDGNLR